MAIECLRELPDRAAVTWYCDTRCARTERNFWMFTAPYAPRHVGIQLSFHEATSIVTLEYDSHSLPAGKTRRVLRPHVSYHVLTAARVDSDEQQRACVNGLHEMIARELPVLLHQVERHMPYMPDLAPAEPRMPMICHRVTGGTVVDFTVDGIERARIYRESLESLVRLGRALCPRGHVDNPVQR